MTVCIGIAVNDGVVFAADSATTLEGIDANGQHSVINVYKHGNKVFNLVKGLPLVSMTCGMGNFGVESIASLTKDLRALMGTQGSREYVDSNNYTLQDVATKAQTFFLSKYQAIQPPLTGNHSFEYWIGGYGSNNGANEIWKFGIANGAPIPPSAVVSTGFVGVTFGGSGGEPVHRLLLGHAPGLKPAIVAAGLPQQVADNLFATVAQNVRAPLVWPAMPIQDAIELADYLVEMSKRFVRFLPGADTVGGDTDLAVVTKHERFKWVRRKHYYPVSLNPLETDHV